MTNSSNDRLFLISLLTGLIICVGLYLTEAVHFYQFGWKHEPSIISDRSHPQCRSVSGTSFELDCPVSGYGYSRFWLPPWAHHFIYKERDWEPSKALFAHYHNLAQKDPLTSR